MFKFFQNKSIMLIIASFLLILIGGEAIYYFVPKGSNAETIPDNIISEPQEEPKKMLSVDLKGAVKEPKVYSLEEGSTLADLITQDLLNSDAELKNINLSMILTDGLVIEIPVKEKTTTPTSSKKVSTNNNNTQTTTSVASKKETNGSNKVTIESSKVATEKEKEVEVETKPLMVNINTAEINELTKLNGIGEAKAKAIISYRNSNGLFAKTEDILNVKGIGESIYAKIKDFITV